MIYNTLKKVEAKTATFDNWREAYNYFKRAQVLTSTAQAFRAKYDKWGDKMPSETFEAMFKTVRGEILVTYSRKPTQGEINFGYGATHYADFDAYLCLKPDGSYKKRIKGNDGLIYTR
jgi:hypothetical protein